jgi:phosphatidylserine/phosphatidylglycerophosphate/cardiolipin synthase-like enzyme
MRIKATLLKNSEIYEALFHKAFHEAKRSISIATANVKNVHVAAGAGFSSIIELFEAFVGKGVEIRLLHSGVPSASFLRDLKRSKLPEGKVFQMRRCPRVHFKAVIVDARKVFMGSPNLTGAGMGAKSQARRNFELGILSSSEQLVDGVSGFFDAVWEGEMCPECERRRLCPAPIDEPEAQEHNGPAC